MNEIIISLLVLDVFLSYFYRYLDSRKPKPVSSIELFFLLSKNQEELKKILSEENKETRLTLLQNYLKTRDLINLKKDK